MYYSKYDVKSNTANALDILGIFHGKKKAYNELILKSLITGSKTVKQIVEYIYLNTEQKKRHNPLNVKRSIYSVIDRPRGRLKELSEKQYIEKRDGLWRLTLKGFCVSLTLFKDFDSIKRCIDSELFDQAFKGQFKMFAKHPLLALLKTKYVEDKFEEYFTKVESDPRFGEWFLLKLKECTEGLIKDGVDLDVLSREEFFDFIGVKMAYWFGEYISERS
jgi:hypothetical protein